MPTFSETLTLRLDKQLLARARASAERRGLRLADLVRSAVRHDIGDEERRSAPAPVLDALTRARAGRPTQEDLDVLVAAVHRAPGAIEALEAYREAICQEMIHANEALVQAMFIVATGGSSPERLVGFMAQVDDHLSRASAGIKGMGAFGMITADSEA